MGDINPEGFVREGGGCICGPLYHYGGHVEPGQFDPECPFHNPAPTPGADPGNEGVEGLRLTDEQAEALHRILMFSHPSARFINIRAWALSLAAARDAQVRAEALREAADAWQQGEWADAPRRDDPVVERIANGNFVHNWLRARADHEAPHAEESGSTSGSATHC